MQLTCQLNEEKVVSLEKKNKKSCIVVVIDITKLFLLNLYTANVYRNLQVLYREIRVRGFQIYGDCG